MKPSDLLKSKTVWSALATAAAAGLAYADGDASKFQALQLAATAAIGLFLRMAIADAPPAAPAAPAAPAGPTSGPFAIGGSAPAPAAVGEGSALERYVGALADARAKGDAMRQAGKAAYESVMNNGGTHAAAMQAFTDAQNAVWTHPGGAAAYPR
jgi:hypothetical protein